MQIIINGIKENLIIGCNKSERILPQEISIDLEILIDKNNEFDELKSTIDYDYLIIFIKKSIKSTNYKLLETLSQFIISSLFKEFDIIKEVKITITKPAINGLLADSIQVKHEEKRAHNIALALGSNSEFLPEQQIISAIELLEGYISNIKIGGFYKTKPFGFEKQNDFINTAITAKTTLDIRELFSKIKKIEKLMGKKEICINGPRIIDIDIILFDSYIYKAEFLTVPHKMAHLRDFVLQPLIDIDPNLLHPKYNLTVSDLYKKLDLSSLSIIDKISYYKKY